MIVFFFHPHLARIRRTVLVLDAAGLGLFTATGTLLALKAGVPAVGACILGMLTGIGGGLARDILTGEIPVVLRQEVYALAALLGAFAAMAVFLALVGIYGVISHGASRRVREIGVRMALGARRAQVVSAVLRDSLAAVAAGLLIGIGGALAAGRAMASLLYDVSQGDPAILAATAAAVTATAALAAWLPARRAARLDPVAALRSE